MSRRTLRDFVVESNRIEGIVRSPKMSEIEAHERLLARETLNVASLTEFVHVICRAPLRKELGMNVYVGEHVPPPGGPDIMDELAVVLLDATKGYIQPYDIHCRYETLHPFMDGNGRSGRAVWLWQMKREDRLAEATQFGFLHLFYYQALQAHPGRT